MYVTHTALHRPKMSCPRLLGEHRLGPGEGSLGVDHPIDFAQGAQIDGDFTEKNLTVRGTGFHRLDQSDRRLWLSMG
jgi:hypothetical protein